MTSRTTLKILPFLAVPALLAGCGGGSGGPGGPGGQTGSTFLGFSQVKPGSTTNINGIGTEAVATLDADGATTSVSDFSGKKDVSADVTYDKNGDLTKVSLTTPSGQRTWDSSNSEENTDAPANLYVADRTDNSGGFFAAARPEENGFEYQTYGVWMDDNADHTKTYGGAYSVGSATDDAKVDQSLASNPVFKGSAGGTIVNGDGHALTADVSLAVDSANKQVRFNTSNSKVDFSTAAPGFDMSGNLGYDAGKNGFSGDVATANGMTGTADGRFYGPGAEEAGGIFGLKGPDGETIAGGFGAVKQ